MIRNGHFALSPQASRPRIDIGSNVSSFFVTWKLNEIALPDAKAPDKTQLRLERFQ